MAWTKDFPMKTGKYWVKLAMSTYPDIAYVYNTPYTQSAVSIDGQVYDPLKSRKLKNALYWDEAIEEPPMPD